MNAFYISLLTMKSAIAFGTVYKPDSKGHGEDDNYNNQEDGSQDGNISRPSAAAAQAPGTHGDQLIKCSL
jgi:hypothetical protein